MVGRGRSQVLDSPDALDAVQDAHWEIHRAHCDYQEVAEARRRLAADIGETIRAFLDELTAAGWSQQEARNATSTSSRAQKTPREAMDKLLTAGEVAELLKVNTEWVWAQARAGGIPHVRLGRYRRFRESAIDDWLCELETGGTTAATRPVRPVPVRRHA